MGRPKSPIHDDGAPARIIGKHATNATNRERDGDFIVILPALLLFCAKRHCIIQTSPYCSDSELESEQQSDQQDSTHRHQIIFPIVFFTGTTVRNWRQGRHRLGAAAGFRPPRRATSCSRYAVPLKRSAESPGLLSLAGPALRLLLARHCRSCFIPVSVMVACSAQVFDILSARKRPRRQTSRRQVAD